MSTTLTQARVDLAEALSAIEGWTVWDHVPSGLTPPAVLVAPRDPYVVPGPEFGSVMVQLGLVLIAPSATNAVVSKALDAMVTEVIFSLGDWTFSEVGAPYVATLNQSQYMACDVAISQVFDLEGE